MVRHTIAGSPINIGYGYDHITGVFLSVYDNRLKYDRNATDEINNVFQNCNVFGLSSGDGAYLDLHTGENGFGIKCSWVVMSEYFKRYGVPRNHTLDLLKQHLKHLKKTDSSTQKPSVSAAK